MNMYYDYLKERQGAEVIEKPYGFAVIVKESSMIMYFQDVYIKPEFRDSGKAFELLKEVENIAKDLGIKVLKATVCPKAHGADHSLRKILSVGFKLASCDMDCIYLYKEIN